MNYTISLTETEQKALEYVAVDVQEWIDNAVKNRARIAIDDIAGIYTSYKLESNEPITAIDKDSIVLAAYAEQVIQSAAQRNKVQ